MIQPNILHGQPQNPNPNFFGSVGTNCPQKSAKPTGSSLGTSIFTSKIITESAVKFSLQITVNNPKDDEYIAIRGLDIDGSGLKVNKTALVFPFAFYFLTESNAKKYELELNFTDYETFYSTKRNPRVFIELKNKSKIKNILSIKLPPFEHKYNCYIGVLKPAILNKSPDPNIYLSDIFREDYEKIFGLYDIDNPAAKNYDYSINNVVKEVMNVEKEFKLTQYTRNKLNIDYTYYFIVECHNSINLSNEITLYFNGKNKTKVSRYEKKINNLNDLENLKSVIKDPNPKTVNYSFVLKYDDTPTVIKEFQKEFLKKKDKQKIDEKYKNYNDWVDDIKKGSFIDDYVHNCINNKWINIKQYNKVILNKSDIEPLSQQDLKQLSITILEKEKTINRYFNIKSTINIGSTKKNYTRFFFELELDFLWQDKVEEIVSMDISIGNWKKHLNKNYTIVKNIDTYLEDFIKKSMLLDLSNYRLFVYDNKKRNWEKKRILKHSIPLYIENHQIKNEINKFKNNQKGYIVQIDDIIQIPDPDPDKLKVWEIAMEKYELELITRLVKNTIIIESLNSTSQPQKNESTPWCSSYVVWVLKEHGIECHDSAAAIDNYLCFEINIDTNPANQSIYSICLINSDVGKTIDLVENKKITCFKNFFNGKKKVTTPDDLLNLYKTNLRQDTFKNQHHITFAESFNKAKSVKDSDKVVCLGGNQGNALRTSSFRKDQIMAFLQPNYLKKLPEKLTDNNNPPDLENNVR